MVPVCPRIYLLSLASCGCPPSSGSILGSLSRGWCPNLCGFERALLSFSVYPLWNSAVMSNLTTINMESPYSRIQAAGGTLRCSHSDSMMDSNQDPKPLPSSYDKKFITLFKAGWLSWLECHHIDQMFAGLILGQAHT